MWTKAMFRNIDELHDGDVFYIHSMDETLEYKVYKQQVIYPDETDSLAVEDNKDLATLLTCHPYRYNYQRLLIQDRKSTRLNSSHVAISYAVFCLKKKIKRKKANN